MKETEKTYKKIEFQPRGMRDVYWCWNLNEPFIISYRGDGDERKRYCENCLAKDFSDADHVFICTVFKPFWHKSWDGKDESEKIVLAPVTASLDE